MSDIALRRVREGVPVFHEGDRPDGMYVVLSGKVRVFREREGHETTLAVLNPGDFFGEMGLFDGRPRSATVVAVTPVELRHISPAEFDNMITEPFVRQVLCKLAERMRAVDDDITRLERESSARHDYVSHLSVRRDWAV